MIWSVCFYVFAVLVRHIHNIVCLKMITFVLARMLLYTSLHFQFLFAVCNLLAHLCM